MVWWIEHQSVIIYVPLAYAIGTWTRTFEIFFCLIIQSEPPCKTAMANLLVQFYIKNLFKITAISLFTNYFIKNLIVLIKRKMLQAFSHYAKIFSCNRKNLFNEKSGNQNVYEPTFASATLRWINTFVSAFY